MKTGKHTYWMIIGCVLPLLLVFLAPALGIFNNISLLIYLVAMFGLHLLMPIQGQGGHKHDKNDDHQHSDINSTKTKNHEHHQH